MLICHFSYASDFSYLQRNCFANLISVRMLFSWGQISQILWPVLVELNFFYAEYHWTLEELNYLFAWEVSLVINSHAFFHVAFCEFPQLAFRWVHQFPINWFEPQPPGQFMGVDFLRITSWKVCVIKLMHLL